MGRKIKGRKHRGIRDPEKQREIRQLSLRDKINAPPSNVDEQQIPKSLTRLIDLKEKVERGEISAKRKRKPKRKLGPVTSHPYGLEYERSDKPVPFFQQKQGESDRKFMWRVTKICKSVIDEAAFENKYGVDIKRKPGNDQVIDVVKRKKDELELYMKQIKKEQKTKGKKKSKKKSTEIKLTKSQKRQKKLKAKVEKKLELQVDEFKDYEDNIKFGEIVHEPPTLSAPRKVMKVETSRPGKRNLLLKTILNSNETIHECNGEVEKDKLRKVTNKVIDKKGKRKDLPHALRRQLDKQQVEVIQAYKKLKAQRYNAT